MIIIMSVILMIYMILGIFSRKEPDMASPQQLLKPFYRMGSYLYRTGTRIGWRPEKNRAVQERLRRLYPQKAAEELSREYYVGKLGLTLALVLAGTLLGGIIKFQSLQSMHLQGGNVLRGSYTQEGQKVILEGRVEDGEEQLYEITVEGMTPAREEADTLEAQFWEELVSVALGNNTAADSITGDLELVQELEGYPFRAEWKSGSPARIDDYGWVRFSGEEGAEEVVLYVTVSYGEWEWEHEWLVTVLPAQVSAEDGQYLEIQDLLETSEQESRGENVWTLPQTWNGLEISWKEKVEDNSLILWMVVLAAAVGSFFLKDRDLGEQLAKREQVMRDTYPMIVNKLVMYLGAGMTVRGALGKIAAVYLQERDRGQKENPAYEEIVLTCRELKTGISEQEAYERLGAKSGLREYMRLSALLSQNLRKGSGALLERLWEEVDRSRQEQMNHFRQKGEEVSTKLLVPMVMLLGIIMVMIMIPAFEIL